MSQYSGYCRSVVGSSIIYGDTNSDFVSASIRMGDFFRFNYAQAPSYTIATILSATKIELKEKVTASRGGYPYIITKDLTTYRNYAKPYQGDYAFADVLREQVVDKVDLDIGKIKEGTASRGSVKLVLGIRNYRIEMGPFEDRLYFLKNGWTVGLVGTTLGSWIEV